MHQIVGGIEVEHQFFRRALERRNELLDQNPLRGHRRGAIGAVLEPAQRRAGGRRLIFTHRRLHRQIVAQPVVVVEVFVALAQSEHPLPQQLFRRVLHQTRVARIGSAFATAFNNPSRRSTCRSNNNPPSELTSPPSKRTSISRRPSFANGTWVAVQFGIGGISTVISLDNRFNVGSYDSADLISRFGMKYSG